MKRPAIKGKQTVQNCISTELCFSDQRGKVGEITAQDGNTPARSIHGCQLPFIFVDVFIRYHYENDANSYLY